MLILQEIVNVHLCKNKKAVDGNVNDFGSNHMIMPWDWQKLGKVWCYQMYKSKRLQNVGRVNCPWRQMVVLQSRNQISFGTAFQMLIGFVYKVKMVGRFKSYPCSMEFGILGWKKNLGFGLWWYFSSCSKCSLIDLLQKENIKFTKHMPNFEFPCINFSMMKLRSLWFHF